MFWSGTFWESDNLTFLFQKIAMTAFHCFRRKSGTNARKHYICLKMLSVFSFVATKNNYFLQKTESRSQCVSRNTNQLRKVCLPEWGFFFSKDLLLFLTQKKQIQIFFFFEKKFFEFFLFQNTFILKKKILFITILDSKTQNKYHVFVLELIINKNSSKKYFLVENESVLKKKIRKNIFRKKKNLNFFLSQKQQ